MNKRHRTLSLILTIVIIIPILLLTLSFDANAESSNNFEGYTPIYTKSDLTAMRYSSGNFYLANDIIFTSEDFSTTGDYYNNGKGWEPIPSFSGIFDGNGHTIYGLQINMTESGSYTTHYGGFFSITDGATIKNVTFKDGLIKVYKNNFRMSYAGTIVALARDTTFINCHNYNDVYCCNASGIVGEFVSGSMTGCTNRGEIAAIEGDYDVSFGGLVARSPEDNTLSITITDCANYGKVHGGSEGGLSCGGIIGSSYSTLTTITNCANEADVGSSTTNRSGGIAGVIMGGTVSCCYNNGNIISGTSGGIIGDNGRPSDSYEISKITNCYNTGNVTCTKSYKGYAGGIAGTKGIIKNCYNIGTVSSTVADTQRYGAITGLRYSMSECYSHNEQTYTVSNTVTLVSKEDMKKRDTYQNFDFDSIWSISADENNGYPTLTVFDKAEAPDTKSYSETHGWCLANTRDSFGYSEKYRISLKTYYELYGISLGTLLESSLSQLPKWSGSCFGLSLLSLAEYYNIIELSPFFSQSGDTLYQYGYESIYVDEETGEQCFTVKGNDAVIDIIEKAHLSQDSAEFAECEILQNDSDFLKLISFLSSEDAKPIMVTFWYNNGGVLPSGHSMVLTTDMPPTPWPVDTNWYYIPAYDSNAPVGSDLLENPTKHYLRENSYLLVNPTTSQWAYYANGKFQASNTYNSFEHFSILGNLTGQTIFYHDVSKLDSTYFTESLNLWHYRIQLKFSGQSIEIKDEENVVFKMANGEVQQIAENYYCKVELNDTADNTDDVYTLFSNGGSVLNITSDDFEILAINDDYAFVSTSNDLYETKIDFESGIITSASLDQGTENVIGVQDLNSNQALLINANSVADSFVSLQLSDGQSVVVSSPGTTVECECENIDSSNVQQHTFVFRYDNEMHWYECLDCDEQRSEPDVHTYTDWSVIKEATEAETGIKEKSCVCGHSVTEEIPKESDFTLDTESNDHSDCTASGWVRFWMSIFNFFRRIFNLPPKCVCGKLRY